MVEGYCRAGESVWTVAGNQKEPGKFKGLKGQVSCTYRRGAGGRSTANWARIGANDL